MKKALITGITGQDGSYLADLLLQKDYEVHGFVRRSSSLQRERIDHLLTEKGKKRLHLHYGDLNDSESIRQVLKAVKLDELYHLGGQSHVKISYEMPEYTTDVSGVSTLRFLEAIREIGLPTKFYHSASSEMFGRATTVPQTETTPFHPQSPYAISKVFGYWTTVSYRENYQMFCSNGIMYNHESPRRGENFVTRKITLSLNKIVQGKQEKLSLGNLDATRDWGYAPDYVEAMWLILQANKPDDFIVASGESHSIREFVETATEYINIDIQWIGKGVNEHGIDRRTRKTIIDIDPVFFRPTEIGQLQGNPEKIKKALGWKPTVGFKKLVQVMMEADRQQK
ncbi:MAG: GDP-mannose 4,6-dehydratase [Patescibacteria group bacterium]